MQDAFIQAFQSGHFPGARHLGELGAINSRAAQRLCGIQSRLVTIGVDGVVEQARLMSRGADLPGLMQAQSAWAVDCGGRLLAAGSEAAQVLSETREEWLAWLSKGFEDGEPAAAKGTAPKPRRARRAGPRKKA